MPSVELIYQQNVLPLPPKDRIRLAELIMSHANDKAETQKNRRSVYEILQSRPLRRVFKDSAEVDKHIRSERDSWDD